MKRALAEQEFNDITRELMWEIFYHEEDAILYKAEKAEYIFEDKRALAWEEHYREEDELAETDIQAADESRNYFIEVTFN